MHINYSDIINKQYNDSIINHIQKMEKKISICVAGKAGQNFIQCTDITTGQKGLLGKRFFNPDVVNPITKQKIKVGANGCPEPGECFEAYVHTTKGNAPLLRMAISAKHPSESVAPESNDSVVNDCGQRTYPLKRITLIEHDHNEDKSNCCSPLQRTKLFKAIVGLTQGGGTARLFKLDQTGATGDCRSALLRYNGSFDKLEASLRSELANRTSSLVDCEFHWLMDPDGKVYLEIEVRPSPTPILLDDCVFVRNGNITKQLHGAEMLNHIMNYKDRIHND